MKLIDFREFDLLNRLRQVMGAQYYDLEVILSFENLDQELIAQLEKDGLDVNLDEIKVKSDQTLTHKNRRVILYIRDCNYYDKDCNQKPVYHIANCRTYQGMVNKNRKDRYVIATRDDGLFVINRIVDNQIISTQEERLRICKNCLMCLNWKKYKTLTSEQRDKIVQDFSLQDFFHCYPKNLLNSRGHSRDKIAVKNLYPANWDEITKRHKKDAHYRCSKCKINLSRNQKFLDLHHCDGNKSNNIPSNLQVLCVECHSKIHPHMKNNPRLLEFKRSFNR